MITALGLVRNVGSFDSVDASALGLGELVLVFAENGRGKTTLCAVMRSLSTGEAVPILERRRLGSTHDSHVVIECSGGSGPAVFQQGTWSRTYPDLHVFDDSFVEENVYSGLKVEFGHRQGLHEVVVGRRGATLARHLQELVDRINGHNAQLHTLADAIPANRLHGLPVAEFCHLERLDNLDARIVEAERAVAVASERDRIRAASSFDDLSLPAISVREVNDILRVDLPSLDSAAVERLSRRFGELGPGAEEWVADGMEYLGHPDPGHHDTCPFCQQALTGSPIAGVYHAYFSDEYRNLRTELDEAVRGFREIHSAEAMADFERTVRATSDLCQFWSRYIVAPAIGINAEAVLGDWRAARDAVLVQLEEKRSSPLEVLELTEETLGLIAAFNAHAQEIERVSRALFAANGSILTLQESENDQDAQELSLALARLRATSARHSPEVASQCEAYLSELQAKQETEELRGQTRRDLDDYRETAFPACEEAVNAYLGRFNAGFRLTHVAPVNTRGGPACGYGIVINDVEVPVGGGEPAAGQPCFGSTLSAGDRKALAFAFFCASLDADADLGSKTVVIDDPVSSLDDHRELTTIHQIRRIARAAAQVIVLSHDKPFLCAIWQQADPSSTTALEIRGNEAVLCVEPWNVTSESLTEHDRRDELLSAYLAGESRNSREVAEALRPHLEAYLRVACPRHFPPGTQLRSFLNLCRQRTGTPDEILNPTDAQELAELVDYANLFHHDTNPAWRTQAINDGELRGFVTRTRAFTTLGV